MSIRQASRSPRSAFLTAPSPARPVADAITPLARERLGEPLPSEAQRYFGARFGHDFARVRIHADGWASHSAHGLGADAYTYGEHVVFAAGRYQPDTREGSLLLAHELAHVTQNRHFRPEDLHGDPPIASRGCAAEQEAEGAAALAVAGREAPLGSAVSPQLALRCDSIRDKPREVPVLDDAGRRIGSVQEDSAEFEKNYIDCNISHVLYWSTPYAATDARFREFQVVYNDQRKLKLSLDQIPIRYKINTPETRALGLREARVAFRPTCYRKKDGFYFPNIYCEGSTPRLIDIATTIEFNHRQRERFLEIAELTFWFGVILSAYAVPPSEPAGQATPARGIRFRQRPPMPDRPPMPERPPTPERPPERPPTPKRPSRVKTSTRESAGTPGEREASVKATEARESEAPPKSPLTGQQQAISDALIQEHPGLHPNVAADAARGGERAAGRYGKGGDVTLVNGGRREVSVHTGAFDARTIGTHLEGEARQAGTTQVYLQISTTGATREGFLGMVPQLQRAYLELNNVYVKVFGPNGMVWWSGIFHSL